ncbi:hypothetical protein LPJ61_000102 [Coemansia biformis]|uniref:S-adenosyl-L-methionine-dependent methyltransferase n=1 Tax=Coemansia biformis TaxID=1286918 RepID=A0A9W7YJH6_9FUNG|nr:hypothetical protein LPJ61_000102 [Coemansia biformis]
MFLFNETSPSDEELRGASAELLRSYYAAKASINPNIVPPSVPSTIPKVFADTVAQQGESTALMAVSEYQGMLQNFFVGLIGAKRVLEIGSFTGSSAIFFANALKRNGVAGGLGASGHKPVIGLDISERYANIARKNFVNAGVEDYVDIIVGDARANLASLEGQVFDIVFLDADKPSYQYYYDTVIEKGIVAKSGLIIADNTAFDCTTPFIGLPAPVPNSAKPLEVTFRKFPDSDELGKTIHEFNEYVRHDPRTEVLMLPLYTGITLIRLLDG